MNCGVRVEKGRIERNTPRGIVARLHRDDAGAISLLTVFTVLGFAMLLGMVINVGKSIDGKVRRQHAADAATYTGTVILARGMNCVAFANHMLCEVFAMTAYMREGRDRNAEQMVPDTLAAWSRVAPIFARSSFEKFARLGSAMPERIRQEQELVTAFGELTAAKSEMCLPVLEYILGMPESLGGQPFDPGNGGGGGGPDAAARTHLIPEFQRAVVRAIPEVAQLAMQEVTEHHLGGRATTGPQAGRGPMSALWRTRVIRVGDRYEQDPLERTLPALDPTQEGYDARARSEVLAYADPARGRRNQLAGHYLDLWNYDRGFDLGPFHREFRNEGVRVSAKMSVFHDYWRIFTCGQLNRLLLEEYPNTNLPHMMRRYSDGRDPIETDHMFVGTVFTPAGGSFMPGMFDGRRSAGQVPNDSLTFTQAFLFLPRRRFVNGSHWLCPASRDFGGAVLGEDHCVDAWPVEWGLFSQNWLARLVPATTVNLDQILQVGPTQSMPGVRAAPMGNLTTQQIRRVSFH
jgi:hypothetical protein